VSIGWLFGLKKSRNQAIVAHHVAPPINCTFITCATATEDLNAFAPGTPWFYAHAVMLNATRKTLNRNNVMTKFEHLSNLLFASYASIALLEKHAATKEEKELCRYLLSDGGLIAGYNTVIRFEYFLRNRRRTKKPVHGQS
jgi:hypothetical protein